MVTSSGKSIPAFAADFGTRLVAVIPGKVFASKQSGLSFSSSRKSMRAISLKPRMLNAYKASELISDDNLSGIEAGTIYSVMPGLYLQL